MNFRVSAAEIEKIDVGQDLITEWRKIDQFSPRRFE
jgi:hypothetical protein